MEIPVKITFVGDSTVGKSSLVRRLRHNTFSPETNSSTIGAAFVAMRFPNVSEATNVSNVSNVRKGRMYHIWDTAGQERYGALIPLYISGAQVIVIVYDITNRDSYKRIEDYWFKYIRENLRLQEDDPLPMLYMLGNKLDLAAKNRAVDTTEARRFADEHSMGFLEVSAKTGAGAIEVFQNIATHADNLIIRQGDALKLNRNTNTNTATRTQYCCSVG